MNTTESNETSKKQAKFRCKKCKYPRYFNTLAERVKHQRKAHPWNTTNNVMRKKPKITIPQGEGEPLTAAEIHGHEHNFEEQWEFIVKGRENLIKELEKHKEEHQIEIDKIHILLAKIHGISTTREFPTANLTPSPAEHVIGH